MKAYVVSLITLLLLLTGSVFANENEPQYVHNNDGSITVTDGDQTYDLLTEIPHNDMGIQEQAFSSFDVQNSTSSAPELTCNGSTSCSVYGYGGDRVSLYLNIKNADIHIWEKKNTGHCTVNRTCSVSIQVPPYSNTYYFRVHAMAFKNGQPSNVVKYIRIENEYCRYPDQICDIPKQ